MSGQQILQSEAELNWQHSPWLHIRCQGIQCLHPALPAGEQRMAEGRAGPLQAPGRGRSRGCDAVSSWSWLSQPRVASVAKCPFAARCPAGQRRAGAMGEHGSDSPRPAGPGQVALPTGTIPRLSAWHGAAQSQPRAFPHWLGCCFTALRESGMYV